MEGQSVSAKRDIASLEITLDPNGSYFAFDNNGVQWSDSPVGLRM